MLPSSEEKPFESIVEFARSQGIKDGTIITETAKLEYYYSEPGFNETTRLTGVFEA